MKKFDCKKIMAVLFVGFIIVGFSLTFCTNQIEIFGGLYRGFVDTPQESSILTKVGNSFRNFDARMNNFFIFRNQAVNTYGLVQRISGRKLVDDVEPSYSVLKLNNGYLTFRGNVMIETDGVDTSSEDGVIYLDKFCKEHGIDYFFVNGLSKNTNDEDLLPKFYPYVDKENGEYDFTVNLQKKGIALWDVQKELDKQKIDKYELFYKTDHHWHARAGLWVSKLISYNLNEQLGYILETKKLDISQYDIETYEQSFLGTQGKRVGQYYSSIDDFELILPKYETDISVNFDGRGIKRGTFEEVLIHRESITPDNILNINDTAYDAYMGGNHNVVEIHNHKVNNGKKALFVQNSFGCVVSPYLSQVFEDMVCVDIRGFNSTDNRLEDCILQVCPDIVIRV